MQSTGPFLAIQWLLLGQLALISLGVALGLYFAGGLYFHFAYYRRRRAEPDAWKCQPNRFPSRELLRSQILLGTLNMTTSSLLSAIFIYGVRTAGWSRLYFDVARYGWLWLLASTIIYFLVADLALYLAHRAYHRPFLFRHVHRWHHRYIAPTAFASVATHPVEVLSYQMLTLLPLFVLPVHAASVVFVLLYTNYLATIDHSGVRLHSIWPWQAPTQFHDDHHVHFHVNYGQNLAVWDRLFGTFRRRNRRYGADVFGGRGAPVAEGLAAGRDALFDYSARTLANPPPVERKVTAAVD